MCIQQCSNNPQNIYLHISNLSICSTQKEPEQGLQLGLFSGEQSESRFAVRRLMESFYEKFVQSSVPFCQKQSDWIARIKKSL